MAFVQKTLRCPDGVKRQARYFESTKTAHIRVRQNGNRVWVKGKVLFGKVFKPTGDGRNGNPFITANA